MRSTQRFIIYAIIIFSCCIANNGSLYESVVRLFADWSIPGQVDSHSSSVMTCSAALLTNSSTSLWLVSEVIRLRTVLTASWVVYELFSPQTDSEFVSELTSNRTTAIYFRNLKDKCLWWTCTVDANCCVPIIIRYEKTRKRDHIIPVLASLYWLPVTARIRFKIALLTCKTLTTHQPSYIDDLLQQHCSSWQRRSSGHSLLEIPRMRTTFAQHSFTYSAPHIWNALPRNITDNLNVTVNTFNKKLKTFYYTTSYA